jgi:L-ascorbate metabolism protein UlaG (beta-lactamase superfamily)
MKALFWVLICGIFFLTTSCTMIKVTKSEYRGEIPQTLKVAENTTLTTWGAIKINKTHFFPSSFQLKSDHIVVYIDPVQVDHTEKADYILITHAHPDHFSLTDIKNLSNTNTIIICPKAVFKKLKNIDAEIKTVRPGEKLDFADIKVQTTEAYNSRAVFLWIKAHPQTKENVGYILTLNNGFRVYHAGDSDYLEGMSQMKDIDLALIPIGGDKLTMNIEEAAQIVNEMKPAMVVPMHYEVLKKNHGFKSLINEAVRVIEFE